MGFFASAVSQKQRGHRILINLDFYTIIRPKNSIQSKTGKQQQIVTKNIPAEVRNARSRWNLSFTIFP
jgi:hypothetical protein